MATVTDSPASSDAATIRATRTPGLFAKRVSGGRWNLVPHLVALDKLLVAVSRGHCRKLIVEMPPRHGKSELISKYFPTWYLGTHPDRNVILTSATDELALDFSAAARDVIAEFGPSILGHKLRSDSQARHRWQLEAGGMLRAAGVGGSIMGRGGHLLIVDDYFKSHEPALSETQRDNLYRWYCSTASTRLAPDGAEIIVATRWHPKDLIGRLLVDQPGQWTRLRLPALAEENDPLGRTPGEALWPDRYSAAWMGQRRLNYIRAGYEWMWSALYQQDPPDVLDAEWPASYFPESMWFDEWPTDDRIIWRVMALDPSVGATDRSDYSATVMLAVDTELTMWVDADIARRDIFSTVRNVLPLASAFNPHVFGVETIAFQKVMADLFWQESQRAGMLLNVKGLTHGTIAKDQRLRALLTTPLARGTFRFRRNSPGTALLVEQLKGFPSTKFDDGPDALAMAVRLVEEVTQFGAEGPEPGPQRVYA